MVVHISRGGQTKKVWKVFMLVLRSSVAATQGKDVPHVAL